MSKVDLIFAPLVLLGIIMLFITPPSKDAQNDDVKNKPINKEHC